MIDQINIEAIKDIARAAGGEILEVYGTAFSVDVKEDQSPLTEADRRGNVVIVSALKELYPDIPMITEENKAVHYSERKNWEYFWLIDPLDGTKEFIKRNGEFTVNIALVHQDTPVLGVVYQPVGDRMFWGMRGAGAWLSEKGGAAERLRGGGHYSKKAKVTVVASRSHRTQEVEDFVESLKAAGKEVEFLSAGSSLKICLVAQGRADVYPRLGPTMEWDTAAAHAIALEAGRKVLAAGSGTALIYNKENLLNPSFFVE
jgi:3'(2'), 5'-bisphosphate nucleotidase